VIASLLDLTAKNEYTPARLYFLYNVSCSCIYLYVLLFRLPEQNEIEHNLRRFPMRTRTEKEHRKLIEQIREIMHSDRRQYLTVFRINSERNLKQTIYHAIFRGKKKCSLHFLVGHIFLSFVSSFCSNRFI
jgi:hypothetical protein